MKGTDMKKGTIAGMLGLAVGCVALTQGANAAILIDVDGPGTNVAVQVESFDFLPGNSLNVGALVQGANQFTNLYQARLGAVLDSAGNVIILPGLNDLSHPNAFEITAVAQFDLQVTGYNAGIALTTTTTAIVTAPGSVNYVKFYYDPKPNANDLLGTGFDDGILILQGTATFGGSSFVEFNTLPAVAFDQFGSNNYPGVTTKTGVGGLLLDAAVSFTDPAFFSGPIAVASINSSTTNVFPFQQIDPSKLFVGGVVPQIGAINGISGPDIQIQTDATVSFRPIPEPASMMLLGLGAMGMLVRRRRA
jgi:hypothetical protein